MSTVSVQWVDHVAEKAWEEISLVQGLDGEVVASTTISRERRVR